MAARPNNTPDKTRDLQRKLYRAAKRSPSRRFHALDDRVHRRDVLRRAWEAVRANRGAPGADAITIADIEAAGVEGFLDDLQVALREGTSRTAAGAAGLDPQTGHGQAAKASPARGRKRA